MGLVARRAFLIVFFFNATNQRVISASNDAPKTISRDSMIAGRSHLSIYRGRGAGSEIKIKGTVQRQAGNLWLLRAIHCSSRGALPTPHSSPLPSSLNRQRSTLIVLSLVQKLNSGMEIECCFCEQPISNQKIIFTAISLDAHNNNIRFPSQNSASAYEP